MCLYKTGPQDQVNKKQLQGSVVPLVSLSSLIYHFLYYLYCQPPNRDPAKTYYLKCSCHPEAITILVFNCALVGHIVLPTQTT